MFDEWEFKQNGSQGDDDYSANDKNSGYNNENNNGLNSREVSYGYENPHSDYSGEALESNENEDNDIENFSDFDDALFSNENDSAEENFDFSNDEEQSENFSDDLAEDEEISDEKGFDEGSQLSFETRNMPFYDLEYFDEPDNNENNRASDYADFSEEDSDNYSDYDEEYDEENGEENVAEYEEEYSQPQAEIEKYTQTPDAEENGVENNENPFAEENEETDGGYFDMKDYGENGEREEPYTSRQFENSYGNFEEGFDRFENPEENCEENYEQSEDFEKNYEQQKDYRENLNQQEEENNTNTQSVGAEDVQPKKTREELKEEIRRKYMVSESENFNVAKIMVLGVGGGGNNAVNRMIDSGVKTAHFVALNTDIQALMLSHCDLKDRYQIGAEETKGLGAGADPEVGERAAEESKELIEELVDGVDLLFITAGMGGGTGSGAAPVIAKIAKEKGCLTVAVVTKPFSFEGKTRIKNAEKAIANLKKYVDTIIIIPNDKLMEALRPDTPIVDAFKYADDTLRQGICGIADLIATPSLINLDFADIKTILKNRGLAHMGVGRAKGENRVIEAVKEAVSSPLLETTIEGAKGLILNVTGGNDMTLSQVQEAAGSVREIVDSSANLIFGMHIKENLNEEIIITIIATGFDTQDAVSDDNTKAYNDLFTGMQASAGEGNGYNVPRSEPDPYTAPDRQWRIRPEESRPRPQPQERPQPYTPYQPEEEPASEEAHGEEKRGLPSFITHIFGGKKKN